jgi:hypothetical protein
MQGMQKKVGVSPLEACVAKLEGKLNVVCVELKEVRQFQVLHEPNILIAHTTYRTWKSMSTRGDNCKDGKSLISFNGYIAYK